MEGINDVVCTSAEFTIPWKRHTDKYEVDKEIENTLRRLGSKLLDGVGLGLKSIVYPRYWSYIYSSTTSFSDYYILSTSLIAGKFFH